MKIDYSFRRMACSGWAIGQDVTIFLPKQYSVTDLFETIRHESIHAVIEKLTRGRTSEKKDHWAIQRMFFN